MNYKVLRPLLQMIRKIVWCILGLGVLIGGLCGLWVGSLISSENTVLVLTASCGIGATIGAFCASMVACHIFRSEPSIHIPTDLECVEVGRHVDSTTEILE